jgi:hypothetical protein
MIGISSPGKPYLREQARGFPTRPARATLRRRPGRPCSGNTRAPARHLASQQNVFAGLRHRTVGGRHDQDRAVHLGGTGDHVLDEVGVARAVDVGIVTLFGFVLDVRDGDRHRLGFVADGTALGDIGIRLGLGQPLAACTARIAPVVVVLPWSM